MTTADATPLFPALRRRDHRREHAQKITRAVAERASLIVALGGKCVDCGDDDAGRLEFDHLAPREWTTRNHHQLTRMRFYRREAAAGLIELRCRPCNARKGQPTTAGDATTDEGDDW